MGTAIAYSKLRVTAAGSARSRRRVWWAMKLLWPGDVYHSISFNMIYIIALGMIYCYVQIRPGDVYHVQYTLIGWGESEHLERRGLTDWIASSPRPIGRRALPPMSGLKLPMSA